MGGAFGDGGGGGVMWQVVWWGSWALGCGIVGIVPPFVFGGGDTGCTEGYLVQKYLKNIVKVFQLLLRYLLHLFFLRNVQNIKQESNQLPYLDRFYGYLFHPFKILWREQQKKYLENNWSIFSICFQYFGAKYCSVHPV